MSSDLADGNRIADCATVTSVTNDFYNQLQRENAQFFGPRWISVKEMGEPRNNTNWRRSYSGTTYNGYWVAPNNVTDYLDFKITLRYGEGVQGFTCVYASDASITGGYVGLVGSYDSGSYPEYEILIGPANPWDAPGAALTDLKISTATPSDFSSIPQPQQQTEISVRRGTGAGNCAIWDIRLLVQSYYPQGV